MEKILMLSKAWWTYFSESETTCVSLQLHNARIVNRAVIFSGGGHFLGLAEVLAMSSSVPQGAIAYRFCWTHYK